MPLWVPLGRATGLYGAPGEGKTLLAQMLATACAIGALWLGLPVRRCNSLLMFCEDDLDEMHRRQEDINRAYGCTFADLGAMRWLPRLGDDNALMEFDDGRASHTDLFHGLLSAAKDHQAELVIEDTLADIFAGNENDRGQARGFTQQALGWLAREMQGAVVALAHPTRAGINSGSGESGSTGWVGAFRSHLYMSTPLAPGESEPADPDLRLLTRRKANAARRGEQIELRWTDGVFVPTRPPATGMPDSVELLRTAESVFLDLLAKTTAEGQYLSHNSRSGNYAPRVFTKRPDRGRFNKDSFERAMQTLFAARAIEIVPRKAGDRHFYDVLRVAAAVPESDVAGAASDAGDAKSGATAFTDCAEREGADNVKSDATGTAADGARTVPKARTRKARVRAVRATAARGAGGAGGC